MRNITKGNIGSTIENTNAIGNTTYYRTMNNTSIKKCKRQASNTKIKRTTMWVKMEMIKFLIELKFDSPQDSCYTSIF